MLKKILAVILSVAIIGIPVCAASQFSDLPDSHWGYASVEKLVNDGTVKGYEDGSFRPDNTVTRAEFVKMMGVGTERKAEDYTDVPKDHWGYEYIMTSGFKAEGTEFLPDKPITRGEVVELLWKRQGSKTGLIAPIAITAQKPDSKDAIAWAYSYKIMMGDDGLNLRLYDSISRVEAAALIIRTRETDYNAAQVSFIDTVSADVLRAAFESFDLFDDATPYSADKTITNGEMARAALRLAAFEKNLTYASLSYTSTFEHKYAKDLAIIADNCIGKDKASAEMADKPATIEDTIAAFSFALIKKAHTPLSLGGTNNCYKDVTSANEGQKSVYLTFANENGVQLKGDGTIGAGKAVTHKDLAAILINLDSICGTQTAFSTEKNADGTFKKYDCKLNLKPATYPANRADFACIIENTINEAYEKEIASKGPAKDMFNFAREYGEMFMSKISQLVGHVKSAYGVGTEFIMYPNLVWDSGKGFILRMECVITSVDKPDIDVNSVFDGTLVTPVTGNLYAGMRFFVEIQTGYAIFM